MHEALPEPWSSFLRDVDAALEEPVEVHCLGGFVLATLWGSPRPTGDLDFVEVAPRSACETLERLAGEGSALAERYRLSFHHVTIAAYPEGYASRLIEIKLPGLRRLRLRAFEAHDLVLAKLSRNSRRDREDVGFLVQCGAIERRVLERRFDAELRPYLLDEARGVETLNLWLETLFPAPGTGPSD